MTPRLYLISPSAKWSRWLTLLIMLGLMVSTAYAYRAYSHIHPFYYYKLLGKAFLSGHTDIIPYSLWDVVHYKNKYYLYFGPVPALLIWIPVKLATGIELGDAEINWIMMAAGTCCLFLLIYLMALRQPFASIPGLIICFVATGFGKWMIPELYGGVYEAAIASAYCFTAMGILCLWMHLNHKEGYIWVASASLCFGLAMGSRITYILTAIFLLMAFLYLLRSKENRTCAKLILSIACTFGPFLFCLVCLGTYNYERFGSVFDVGARYQIYRTQNWYPYLDPHFHFFSTDLHSMLLRAYYYLLAPPWEPGMPHVDYGNPQKLSSLWFNTPFSWFLLFYFADWRSLKSWRPEIRLITCGMIVFALLQLAVLSAYFNIISRYETDFAPCMLCVAGIYYLHILQRYRDTYYYWILIALSATLVAFGCFLV